MKRTLHEWSLLEDLVDMQWPWWRSLGLKLSQIKCDWEDCAAWFGCRSYVRYPESLQRHFDAFADARAQELEMYVKAGFDLIEVATVGLEMITSAPFSPPQDRSPATTQ
mgnify:FL=1